MKTQKNSPSTTKKKTARKGKFTSSNKMIKLLNAAVLKRMNSRD